MTSVQVQLFVSALISHCVTGYFTVPDALIEPLSPKGFRVSIPDEEGISLFAFHGKINEEMTFREAGTFSKDIFKAKDGRWTFTDKTTTLKPGDVLNYWTYADYYDGSSKRGYPRDGQSFTVAELIQDGETPTKRRQNGCGPSETRQNEKSDCSEKIIFRDDSENELGNENEPTPSAITAKPVSSINSMSDYQVPNAEIKPLSPKGFSVSIPDVPGIKLFAFHGKINEEMAHVEAGTYSKDILKAKNGKWTFTDKTTELKPGDVLYYWTYVEYFDGAHILGYRRDDESFTFSG